MGNMLRLYDYVLGAIPMSLLGGGTLAYLADLAVEAGVIGGATVAVMLVAYLLFVNPPRDPALGPHQ